MAEATNCLAAEIEAVRVEALAEAIRRQVVLLRFNEARTLDDSFDADEIELLCIRAANAVKDHVTAHPAAEIAARQSRAFEDGARSAEIFARRVHAGQTDKGGAPYTGHLGRVAARARSHAEALGLGEQTAILCAQVGWLHDVIEDCTGEDMGSLVEAGFRPDVCQNVDWLSRNGTTWGDGEPFYPDWIEWICLHTSIIAIIVKLSDVEDNLDPSRTLGGSDKLRARYQAAAEMLRAALAEQEKGDA